MKTKTITKRSDELAEGDIVVSHGLRCLIDRPITKYDGIGGHPAYTTSALVLNRDEVPNDRVPTSWTSIDGIGNKHPNGEHRWTIQGSDFVEWYVEVQA